MDTENVFLRPLPAGSAPNLLDVASRVLVFQLQLDQTHLRLRGEFYVLRRRDSHVLYLSLNESGCPDLEIYMMVG